MTAVESHVRERTTYKERKSRIKNEVNKKKKARIKRKKGQKWTEWKKKRVGVGVLLRTVCARVSDGLLKH